MKKLVYDIFDNMAECIPCHEEADRKISDEVEKEIAKYKGEMAADEAERMRDLCFGVVHTAKREWFAVGFYYAVELMGKGGW